MAQQHKTCTKCGEAKPLDGFAKKKTGKYGVNSQCKSCRSEYDGRYREANRDEKAEYNRRYWESNREILNSQWAKRQRKDRELAKSLATVPLSEPWTPGEDALILADNGMTMYQKAVELGRTLSSARHRRQMLLSKLNA